MSSEGESYDYPSLKLPDDDDESLSPSPPKPTSPPTPIPNSPIPFADPVPSPPATPPPHVPRPNPRMPSNATPAKTRAQTRAEALNPPPLLEPEDELDEGEPYEAAHFTRGDIPFNLTQALNSPDRLEWKEACHYELNKLLETNLYQLVQLPPGRKATGSRWVFAVKRNANNPEDIEAFRARLVAQGFTQIPGIDFFNTHAPTARIESIRGIATVAAIKDWEIHVVDVKSAYLNSEIPDDQPAYVKQPPGFAVKGKEDWVWKLNKALYGLKQSGYLWYEKLKGVLVSLKFQVCTSDPCVFFRHSSSGILIIATHVDDLALFGTSSLEISKFKSEFKAHFDISDKGEISQFLGMTVTRDRSAHTISFSQRSYILSVVSRFRLDNATPVRTPMEMVILSKADCPADGSEEMKDMRSVPYAEAVGSLMHPAIMTRPDITRSVQQVAQFMQNPGCTHWKAVQRIIHYLKGTSDFVLVLGGTESLAFCAFTDSNFVECPSDHGRSVSGAILSFGLGCFSWFTRKQTAVATSTGEAEYYAAGSCGREVIWFRQLLQQLGFMQSAPTTMFVDSTSALKNLNSPQITNANKHIKIHRHWIRAAIKEGDIVTDYVPSKDNFTGIFTKAISLQSSGTSRVVLFAI